MRVLVIQNFDGSGPGQLAAALNEAGAQIDLRRIDQGEELPDSIRDHDGLIVLGGGQSALADEQHPYLPGLVRFMRAFVESGRATLGVCLGSQLLARAFDAQVLIGQAHEFGWRYVTLTPEAADDPVFGALPTSFPAFQWHDDHYMLPRGGVRLAGNLVAHNQAYRIGARGYGVQFHFEADRPHVAEWSQRFAGWIAEGTPDWPMRHEAEADRFGPASDAAGLALARAFVSTIERP